MGCIQMAMTIAVVTKNVHMSRRWKAELVAYGIRLQPLPRIMLIMPLKPNCSPVCLVCLESVQQLVLASKPQSYQTVHQNLPYEYPTEI
jgi:hypothetical protein